jgi:hypothetical protein
MFSLFMMIYGIRYVVGYKKAIKWVLGCAYFLGFYGLVEFVYGRSLFLQFLRTMPTAVHNSYRSGHYRIMGPCGHSLGYGLVLLLFLAIACVDIEKKEIDFFSDYKSVLQELGQTDKRSLEYVVVNEEGPSHNKTFTVNVKIDNILYGTGVAHSKKEAEQEAAKDALSKMAK